MTSKAQDLEEMFYQRMNGGITKIVEDLGGTVTVDIEKEIFDLRLDPDKKELAGIRILEFMERLQGAVLNMYEDLGDCAWVGNVGWKLN